MRNLKYHSPELLSIKSINNSIWADKIIFKKIIIAILDNNINALLIYRRPHYPDEIFKRKLNQVRELKELKNINNDSGFFELSFSLKSEDINDEILEIINELWLEYEHPSLIAHNENKLIMRKDFYAYSWSETTSLIKSIVLFKGVEDDVLWIGKSKNKFLPNIKNIMLNEPKLG